MGLTIHWEIKSEAKYAAAARASVEAMRQICLNLPFAGVGEVIHLPTADAIVTAKEVDGDLGWLAIQSGRYVDYPWNRRVSCGVLPIELIAFTVEVGPGSEPANVGLCRYPPSIDVKYDKNDDARFQTADDSGFHTFDFYKWYKHFRMHGKRLIMPDTSKGNVSIPTRLTGWSWGSFCKTQYASGYGIGNFLRCHISLITALERINKLPGVAVCIDDEGGYGPSTYSTDWREAENEGRKPIYREHKGRHSPAALAATVDDCNETIAALAGEMKDALSATGLSMETPITEFDDFEALEFRGRKAGKVDKFLRCLPLSIPERDSHQS